jgi:hypothetical protein
LLLLAVTVLGAVMVLEFTFLGDKLAADLRLLAGKQPTSAPAAVLPGPRAERAPQALPVLGPLAAGAVAGVDLRPVGSCRPGAECLLRVVVAVHPRASSTRIHWRLIVVDRCTGARNVARTGTLRVPPHTGTGSALAQSTLPRRILAVAAETTAPAHAASRALPVPPTATSC